MLKISSWETLVLLCLSCAMAAMNSPAQTFTSLLSFDGTDGAYPEAALVQATNGNFYGITPGGGANCAPDGCGTVFEITPAGVLTTLYSLCAKLFCADGAYPEGLTLATDGNFYGTSGGGAGNYGMVLKITPAGTPTTLYSFCTQTNCSDGRNPEAGVVQATDGNFYGTTFYGGTTTCFSGYGCGTVFRVTPGGTLTTLHTFQGYPTDGDSPESTLVQATNGNFYGTTANGGASDACGAYGCGTVFTITSSGTLTTLHSFDGTDGQEPGALVQATDGNFYGITLYRGANDNGTVFKITPAGTLTTLYNFCSQAGCTDGSVPAGLVQATDGNFYGTTGDGGANTTACGGYGCGTIFRITPSGTLATLHSFDDSDGDHGLGLVQATNGNFYGATDFGGANTTACGGYGCGTVFTLGVGLGPFVEILPTSGKVGSTVKILGNNLTGSTSVTFNGTQVQSFAAHSNYITTTVPTGATTGYVQVTTAGGTTLTSNVKFRVP
jgi:uncharacterized repeat protein (TIGR03803 family)